MTLKFVWNAWNKFWFESDGSSQMRLFSRVFATLFFLYVVTRTPDLRIAYTNEGILPLSVLNDFPETHLRFSILRVFDSIGLVWIMQVTLLASLLCIIFGFIPRAAAIVAFILHLNFLNRNMVMVYGVDMISSVFLFYICLGDYRRTSATRKRDWKTELGSVAYRLAQIQVCIIYAFAGLDKVKGPSWWNGDALWYVFFNPQYAALDFSWVAHFPFVVMALTYSSVIWEVYFPVLVWVKPVRYPVLIFGVLLHIGIGLTMSMPSFGFLMMCPYTLFLERTHAEKFALFVRKMINPRKVLLRKADESYV